MSNTRRQATEPTSVTLSRRYWLHKRLGKEISREMRRLDQYEERMAGFRFYMGEQFQHEYQPTTSSLPESQNKGNGEKRHEGGFRAYLIWQRVRDKNVYLAPVEMRAYAALIGCIEDRLLRADEREYLQNINTEVARTNYVEAHQAVNAMESRRNLLLQLVDYLSHDPPQYDFAASLVEHEFFGKQIREKVLELKTNARLNG